MSKLVIIRGNSGSGKTTTAKMLQHRLGRNIMLLSQDVIRREILWVKDGFGTEALPLLMEMLQYGHSHCEAVILEGILDAEYYRPLFELASELFGHEIFAYYYDLTFEETLVRHQTKPNRDKFGREEMQRWWKEKDWMKVIPEKVISADMTQGDTVEMIYQDITAS